MNFFSEGFFLGLSLIVAIGAQNAFVLRQGIRKEHQFVTALLCALIDCALITAGSLGLGTLIASMPILLKTVTFFGAAFVAWYGAQAFIRVFRSNAVMTDGNDRSAYGEADRHHATHAEPSQSPRLSRHRAARRRNLVAAPSAVPVFFHRGRELGVARMVFRDLVWRGFSRSPFREKDNMENFRLRDRRHHVRHLRAARKVRDIGNLTGIRKKIRKKILRTDIDDGIHGPRISTPREKSDGADRECFVESEFGEMSERERDRAVRDIAVRDRQMRREFFAA